MRLSDSEQSAIVTAFKIIKTSHQLDGTLHLFGSRTNDNKRGGDIDLLWLCPKKQIEGVRSVKFDLLAKIKLLAGEQKIDLTIIAEEDKTRDPFFKSIEEDLMPLA